MSLFSKEGYPNIKTIDLPPLIFNPRTGTSVFLSVIDNPPKPLREERPITDLNPELTKLFLFSVFENETLSPNDKIRLIDGIKTLIEYQSKIDVRNSVMKRLFGTPDKLCKTYI